jgi:hypothetical protein
MTQMQIDHARGESQFPAVRPDLLKFFKAIPVNCVGLASLINALGGTWLPGFTALRNGKNIMLKSVAAARCCFAALLCGMIIFYALLSAQAYPNRSPITKAAGISAE